VDKIVYSPFMWQGSFIDFDSWNKPRSGGTLKITIKREKLIQVLQAKLKELEDKKNAQNDLNIVLDKYEEELKEYVEALNTRAKAFRKAKTIQELDKLVSERSGGCQDLYPQLPRTGRNCNDYYADQKIEKITSRIKKLELSDQETLELEEGDNYLQDI